MSIYNYHENFIAHGRGHEEKERLKLIEVGLYNNWQNASNRLDEETNCDDASNRPCTFNVNFFFHNLKSDTIGNFLFTSASCDSTQMFTIEHIESIPIGSVCVADVQMHGRGRGGNKWDASHGGLVFSISLSIFDRRNLLLLQYLGAIAVVQVLKDLLMILGEKNNNESSETFDIKWPNDIFYGKSKIGGVLCNSKYKDGRFDVAVGIGLNLTNKGEYLSVQEIIESKMLSEEFNVGKTKICREILLARILEKFEIILKKLNSGGFEEIKPIYLMHWKHSGQKISILEGSTKIFLTIKGLTDTGYLLASDKDGQRYELHPDGNSLDLFDGLIRKKYY